VLASSTVPNPVPDSGATGLLLGLGILSLGLVARAVKNRKR
ncbi:MAG: VPDSG-CTERM sorting domain-containing protein, partial [Opitutaceae bacterium]